jgi:hypothetical protein
MGQRNHRAGGRYYYYELLCFALLGISCGGLAALFNAINVSLAVGRIKYPPRPCDTDVHTTHAHARTHRFRGVLLYLLYYSRVGLRA